MKFRVFCKNKNEYEKDVCFLAENGELFTLHNNVLKPLLKETHTVEMSTGLRDKNGVEIYENDVVVNRELEVASIQWASKDLAFYFCSITSDEFIGFDEINVEEIEIIGNIHTEE